MSGEDLGGSSNVGVEAARLEDADLGWRVSPCE